MCRSACCKSGIAALCNTDLTYANLGGENLKRAIFRNVMLDLTDLGGAILAGFSMIIRLVSLKALSLKIME